jgi:hypothetical protein
MRSTHHKHLASRRLLHFPGMLSLAIASLPLITGCVARQPVVMEQATPSVNSSVNVNIENSPAINVSPSINAGVSGGTIRYNNDSSTSNKPIITIRGKSGEYTYSIQHFGGNPTGANIKVGQEYSAGTEIEIGRPDGTKIRHQVTETTQHRDLPAEIREALDRVKTRDTVASLIRVANVGSSTQVSTDSGTNADTYGSTQVSEGDSGNIGLRSDTGEDHPIRYIDVPKYKAGSEIRITSPDGKKIYRKLDRDMTWEELPTEIREAFSHIAPGTELQYTTVDSSGAHAKYKVNQ